MASESTIGGGTVIRGSVRGDGDLNIHGRVEGSVDVSGDLLIAETALIRSDISARRVIVRGAVLGNISAEQAIVLEAGARVVGDLGAPQIGIRPGGLVRGNVSTAGPLSATGAESGAAAGKARTSPKAVSVAVAPVGRATPAPPAVRSAAAPPQARPVTPARAPARPVAAPAARAVAPLPPPPAAVPPRGLAAPHHARPEPVLAPRTEASPLQGMTSGSAAAPLSALAGPATMHTDTAPSAPAGQASAEQDHEEESAGLGEADEGGGPPPPVVPALRKGAKASLRRKGAR